METDLFSADLNKSAHFYSTHDWGQVFHCASGSMALLIFMHNERPDPVHSRLSLFVMRINITLCISAGRYVIQRTGKLYP